MAEEPVEDVQDGTSPSAEGEAQAAAGAVTASGAEPAETDAQGVPWKNRMAEMERKHDKHVQELQQMFQQQLAAMQPAAFQAAPKAQSQQQYTDEELFALANQGHYAAHVELQQRIAQRTQAAQLRTSLTEQHIGALRQLYPDFNNASSPLYQAANTLYRQYLAAGYPASAETQHTAMSTAAAAYARQQQQQQGVGQASEASRQQQIDAHQSVGGTSVPPAGSNRRRPNGPTPEQQAVAAKVGVKDAAGAIARFQKRANEGRSSFGGGLSQAAERVLP